MPVTEKMIDQLYAGWLAKVIGVRLGAPVEGWTYQKIKEKYGIINGYISDFKNFAADDDTNVPIFFIRALEKCGKDHELEAADVADALLDYAPYEHGFFWWGGYGMSTEHTAYQNLINGIPAPRSGSMAQNGATVAEQIGGQIFIDTWGLVSPGRPELAAKMAKAAASVTHDGNGVYGGIFVACCISIAYMERDIRAILLGALDFIPADCEYARAVRAVMDYHEKNPESWRDCFSYIYENFGYDKYPGNCHIIPNICVMILALLYGKGDFDATIEICTMCGWDTDCNVGNVAAIMGVRGGTCAIDYEKWRRPIRDLLICSGSMGSLNIQSIPQGADYLLKMMLRLGYELPGQWASVLSQNSRLCHFEYEGSTDCMRSRVVSALQEEQDRDGKGEGKVLLSNTDRQAHSGKRSLLIQAKQVKEAEVFQKTYYFPEDFDDSRYDPSFSPLVYPGDTLHCYVRGEKVKESNIKGKKVKAALFARDSRSQAMVLGPEIILSDDGWTKLDFRIPSGEENEPVLALVDEVGILLSCEEKGYFLCYLDDFYWEGGACYTIDMKRERLEIWPTTGVPHYEISQFTRWKGITYLDQGRLHLTGEGRSAAFTGSHEWKDYAVTAEIGAELGEKSLLCFRVQGAMHFYAFGLYGKGRVALLKVANGVQELALANCRWEEKVSYRLCVSVKGSEITAALGESVLFCVMDEERPYLTGSIGLLTLDGSHMSCGRIEVVTDEKI